MKEQIKKICRSKKTNYILFSLIGLAVLVFVFNLGEAFGSHRMEVASHSMGNTHHMGFFDENKIGMHGVAGKVINVTGNKILVADNDGEEKTIAIATTTIIRKQHNTVSVNEMHTDDNIIVIGRPNNNNEVEAKIIRIK